MPGTRALLGNEVNTCIQEYRMHNMVFTEKQSYGIRCSVNGKMIDVVRYIWRGFASYKPQNTVSFTVTIIASALHYRTSDRLRALQYTGTCPLAAEAQVEIRIACLPQVTLHC